MYKIKYSFEQFRIATHLIRWTFLVLPISVAVGAMVALFLWLLEVATHTRWENMWFRTDRLSGTVFQDLRGHAKR